jgi:phosphohistidine phosphatase
MDLYVVRHAIAEPARSGHDDHDRALTDEGERKLKRAVRGMRALGWRFDRVLTSPWLLAPVAKTAPVATDLLCRSPPPELLALLSQAPVAAEPRFSTALVGHEPWLGELIALLATGDTALGEALQLKKGGVVWLRGSPASGGMTIRAALPPKVLRALG